MEIVQVAGIRSIVEVVKMPDIQPDELEQCGRRNIDIEKNGVLSGLF